MKLETDPLLKPDPALAEPDKIARGAPPAKPNVAPGSAASMPTAATGWGAALPLLVGAVLAILGIYWQTAESIVAIWWRSETFAHGFLIVPISLALVWMRRREMAKLEPRTDFLGFLLLAAAGLAWLVAAAGRVQVVQQYAMVTMIPAAVMAIAGRRVAWELAFPLAFLYLGVPVGEFLIEPLMYRTADFTVMALQLTGIPVYREGTFFNIPSGNWSVVEGCSGLRYLIASVTVGVLYAYLTYRSLSRRVLFTIASILVPIVANWMRAYMIVMIAHLSGMKLALGIDHYIYGWVFFGLVMLLLFWVGSFWREDVAPNAAPAAASPAVTTGGAGWAPTTAAGHESIGAESMSAVTGMPARSVSAAAVPAGRFAVATVATIALAGAWPLYAAHLDRSIEGRGAVARGVPAPAGGWELVADPPTDWRPRYEGPAASIFQTYRKGDRVVVLYLGYYRQQQQGAELVTSQNIMVVQKHPVWSNVGDSHRAVDLGKGPLDVRQTKLRTEVQQQRLLVWDWFRVSGRDFTSPYLGKLLLARDKLTGRGDDGVAIIVGTPYTESLDEAGGTLRVFLRDMAPSIDASLARAASGDRVGGGTDAASGRAG